MVTFEYGFIIFGMIVNTTLGIGCVLVKLTALTKTFAEFVLVHMRCSLFPERAYRGIHSVICQKQSIPKASPLMKEKRRGGIVSSIKLEYPAA
jgi:hypothetical protein